jgi:hypothetical protein
MAHQGLGGPSLKAGGVVFQDAGHFCGVRGAVGDPFYNHVDVPGEFAQFGQLAEGEGSGLYPLPIPR